MARRQRLGGIPAFSLKVLPPPLLRESHLRGLCQEPAHTRDLGGPQGRMRMEPGREQPGICYRWKGGRSGAQKPWVGHLKKVARPYSKAQRTVGAGARKRLCPRMAAMRRGAGGSAARGKASAGAAVSPQPPRAGAGGAGGAPAAGGPAGGESARREAGQARDRGRRSPPPGSAPAAALAPAGPEIRASRGAAGSSGRATFGEVSLVSSHSPPTPPRRLGELGES